MKPSLNETLTRLSTRPGCLKPTPIEKMYLLTGIVPPKNRREVAADTKRTEQENDPQHPLNGHVSQAHQLKSRKSLWQEQTFFRVDNN